MPWHHQLDMNVSVKSTCESKRWLDSSLLALLCLTWIDYFSRLRRQRCRHDSRRRWQSLFSGYKQGKMDLLLSFLLLLASCSSSFLFLLNRSTRSTSFTSSMVALLLSFDSLIALLPLWVAGRERLPTTRERQRESASSSSNKKITSQANEQKKTGNQIAQEKDRHAGIVARKHAYLRSTKLLAPTTRQSVCIHYHSWLSCHRWRLLSSSSHLHPQWGRPNLEIDPSTVLSVCFNRLDRAYDLQRVVYRKITSAIYLFDKDRRRRPHSQIDRNNAVSALRRRERGQNVSDGCTAKHSIEEMG